MTHEERRKRRKELAGRIRAGATIDQVRRESNLSLETIRAACKEFGVHLPRPSGVDSFSVLFALLSGESAERVSWRFGIDRTRVSAIRARGRAAGFKLPRLKIGRPKGEV